MAKPQKQAKKPRLNLYFDDDSIFEAIEAQAGKEKRKNGPMAMILIERGLEFTRATRTPND